MLGMKCRLWLVYVSADMHRKQMKRCLDSLIGWAIALLAHLWAQHACNVCMLRQHNCMWTILEGIASIPASLADQTSSSTPELASLAIS